MTDEKSKPLHQMLAEVICRLVIESFTHKSADDVPDCVVQDGSFRIFTPNGNFRVSVQQIR